MDYGSFRSIMSLSVCFIWTREDVNVDVLMKNLKCCEVGSNQYIQWGLLKIEIMVAD